MKKSIIFSIISSGALLLACSPADVNRPYGSKEIPQQVSVTKVVNENGRSIIYYNLPDDENFSYVKAVYEPRPGVTSEMRASSYTDSLIVEGFAEEKDYKVGLYSVSYGETASEPVDVTVSPLQPSYLYAAEQCSLTAEFGGVRLKTKNPAHEKLFVNIQMEKDGQWETILEQFTTQEDIELVARGLESEPANFRVTLEDHFGNTTIGETFNVTPIYEILCDKSLFNYVIAPGEHALNYYSGGQIEHLWDGIIFSSESNGAFQSGSGTFDTYPECYTIDMGKEYTLSRLEQWPYYYSRSSSSKYYQMGDWRKFQVWGATELDEENALFDGATRLDNPNWFLLLDGEVTRISGSTLDSTLDPLTDEEKDAREQGIPRQWDFIRDTPKVRYIKFCVFSTWGNKQYTCAAEVSIYGSEAE